MRLGTTYNNYDEEIIKYADKYGIPPQYLKGHVHQEAKKENGNYIADSFRYEPLSLDIGTENSTAGGLLAGVWIWTPDEWADKGTDYASFHYPDGTLLSPQLSQKIDAFKKIVSMIPNPIDPSCIDYQCKTYGSLEPPETATLTNIYNANNGWAEGSYPNRLYGRKGPCSGTRQGWDTGTWGKTTIAFHNGKYYCNAQEQPGISCDAVRSAFIDWFFTWQDIPAQIPIASTYGLLQIWYITAVQKLMWKSTETPSSKDPILLLDADVSIDLGAAFDSCNFRKYGKIEETKSLDNFKNAIKIGLKRYNSRGSYPADVMANVSLFPPKN
ncbi:MAG: hypothetical protein GYA35_06485 [Thermoanaerobaculaceae bacterium]|nr:hypothetical protein [Thermoanaerobaculaceae bacterium]